MKRHPERLRALQAICAPMKLAPALVRSMMAVDRLRPDLHARIGAGELEFDDVRNEVAHALVAQIMGNTTA